MTQKLIILATFLLLGQTACFGQKSGLTIVVQGAKNHEGKLRVGVFTNAADFKTKSHPLDSAVMAIGDQGQATCTFHQLPPGTYAVAVYHDENNDGILNKRKMGIPAEGVGFSNFPANRRKPPVFGEVAFELNDTSLTLEIPLFYYKNKEKNHVSATSQHLEN